MVWHYLSPQLSAKDAVRYLVGDTIEARPLVQDGEILYALSLTTDVRLAAASVAEQLSRQLALRPDIRTQDTSVSWSQAAKQFASLAKDLRLQVSLGAAMPYAGGLSQSEKADASGDSDKVQPLFTRDQWGERWSNEERD